MRVIPQGNLHTWHWLTLISFIVSGTLYTVNLIAVDFKERKNHQMRYKEPLQSFTWPLKCGHSVFHLKLHPGETEFSGAQTQLPMYQEGESGRQILWMHYSWLWAGFGLPWRLNGKESACIAGDLGSTPGSERSPGKRNGTHSGILAWRIPGTEKPGRLQSMGLQRVGHDWATNTNTA